jgi:hypothetical protein
LQPEFDPRTGGPHPSFAIGFKAGTDSAGFMKDDGAFYSLNTAPDGTNSIAGFVNGKMLFTTTNDRLEITDDIQKIVADDFSANRIALSTSYPFGLTTPTSVAASNQKIAYGAAAGLTVLDASGGFTATDFAGSGETGIPAFIVNRTYNTGFYKGDIRGIWLANSKTVDRSYKANTLTENGTVTEAAVETSAELKGYSGFSDSTNYLSRVFDADLDFGTANFSAIIWFKRTATDGAQYLWARKSTASGGSNIFCSLADGAHTLRMFIGDGSNSTDNSGIPYTGSVWNQLVVVWNGTPGTNSVYINGVLKNTTTNASVGTLTNSNATLAVGSTDNGTSALDQGSVSLFRLSTSTPTATEIRKMYDAEKGMFAASVKCLLQSGSTDAVLDVDVDPLTSKVIVTQTDKINIFDGSVNVSQPTVNSGASEKGGLWGDLRAEQNSAHAYVTAPAPDQRQVNEMVRGLANDLPKGVDLGKAAAWLELNGSGTISITSSHNIKSVTDKGTGLYEVFFATPFKSQTYVAVGSNGQTNNDYMVAFYKQVATDSRKSIEWNSCKASTAALVDSTQMWCAFFGELANE